MKARIDAEEYDDWWLLEMVDPWGQLREDIRFAQLTAHMAAMWGAKKQNGTSFTPDDFLLRFQIDEPPVVQTVAQMEQALLMWARAANVRHAEQQGETA